MFAHLFFILLACLLIAPAVATVAMPAQQQRATQTLLPCYDIPHLKNITIDGRDDDWGERGFRVDLLSPVDGKVRPATEHRASLRLGWDERGLLLLISMANQQWCESEKLDELFTHDSLELYLAPYRSALDSCQWVIAAGMEAKHPEVRYKFYNNCQSTALMHQNGAIIVARHKTDNGGCRLEVLLPWKTIGITPHAGREVAFQIMSNKAKADGTDAYHLVWYPALGAAFSSMRMQRLRLAKAAGEPQTARLNAMQEPGAKGMAFRVLALPALAGKVVQLTSAAQTLATGELQVDAGGYAQATLTVPAQHNQPAYDRVTLLVEHVPVETLVLTADRDLFPVRTLVLDATAKFDNTRLTLTWPTEEAGTTLISRHLVNAHAKTVTRSVTDNQFVDARPRTGRLYEYALCHEGATLPATRYLYAGREVPLEEQRGTVVLIVEQSIAVGLHDEIARLMRDFIGDGWQVIRHDVPRDMPVTAVKDLLIRDRHAQPAVDTVLLLGHVPVPYSGNINPDGHDDHQGAWPADVYYGDLTGRWTDKRDLSSKAEGRLKNIAGDGKFDQDTIPGKMTLAVGRVDCADMPAFAQSEEALLRQYLNRDHDYRHKRFTVAPDALVNDGFSERTEGFSYGGWQSGATLLGSDHVAEGGWLQHAAQSYLLMYSCGPGSFTGGGGLGSTTDLVKTPVHGVFTPIFGSYFVDWDSRDNLMRALLCNAGYPLATFWSGRPHWYLHPMGMGKTIGYCARLTQNNAETYQPTGANAGGIHIALLGDPTLRLHTVSPPADLAVTASPHGAHLAWAPSADQVLGYYVYRASREPGPYQRITGEPVTQTSFDDAAGAPGDWYMVRAVLLQQTPTGSYYNASQGIFGQRANR